MSSALSSSVSDVVRSTYNFSVDKFPLFGPENMKTDQYGLFRSDTGYLNGIKSVSPRYVPHTTDDVVALCEAASAAFNGVADVECYFRSGHYVVIRPTIEDRRNVFGSVDSIWPRVIIRAGYDGQAFKASIGYYRDMCRNMHIVRAAGRETSTVIRHTQNLRTHMDELIEQFGQIKAGWSSLGDVVARMESNRVNMVAFLDAIYGKPDADSKRSVTEHTNRTEAIFKRLQREVTLRGETMSSDFNVSGWLAFNAVQGYIQHDTTRKGRNKVSDGSNLILSLSDTKVAQAEQLALAV